MKILYACDGSKGSLDTAHFLTALAPRDDVSIHVLTVPASNRENDREDAESNLLSASEILAGLPGRVTSEIGTPGTTTHEIAASIVERARSLPADLIAVGTYGRSALARWILGSVALKVTRDAPCPVLITRAASGAIDRVLAGVDGSSCADNAVRWMIMNFPLPASATVRLLAIASLPSLVWGEPIVPSVLSEQTSLLLEREQERLREAVAHLSEGRRATGLTITTDVRLGSPAAGLVAAATEWEADLLVVGSHGLSGMDHWLLGSVSESVIQRAPCSVLVVRPPFDIDSRDGS